MIRKIVSGGQTGVDRAALDAALALGLTCGGWCPKGRLAEDGPLPERYPLRETPTGDYSQRTEWNVRDSDATLILCLGAPEGGTALTRRLARRRGKPCLVANLSRKVDWRRKAAEWIEEAGVSILNVAGPRESRSPGLYAKAKTFLLELLG